MLKKLLFMAVFVLGAVLPLGQKASAYSPYLSANWENNNNVRININSAQSYASVDIYYKVSDSQMWSVVTNLGNTDGSGYYSGIVDLGVPSWSQVSLYAKVGYDQTSAVNLGTGGGSGGRCWGTNCSVGGITFSENNVSLTQGQSRSVNIYTPYFYSGNYYISSNSNTNVATVSISGSTLMLYGNSSGYATITICQQNNSSNCGSVYVTVSGGSSYGNITFSENNPTLTVGQGRYISIYSSSGSSQSYYISSNSDSSSISASISGSSLYLFGNYLGSATIVVCRSGYSASCGTIYATTSGSGSSNVYLNPSSVTVNVGQTVTVSAGLSSVYPGNFYISSNSNSNVATASFSGSTIYVYGQNPGSTTMNVCYQSGGQCAYLYVTVSGYCSGYNCGNSLFAFTSISLPQPTVGQYYSQQLQTSGGVGTVTYSVQSGSLPSGLSLSSSGQIYGTPLNTSATYFTVRAYDNNGRTAVQNFSLTPTSGSNILGALLYSNGTLVKENETVYITYKNFKTGFTNRAAFEGLGYKFSQVSYVGSSGLSDSGYTVWTSASSHPWGAWVKSGNTVYFIHESGLIPIASYDVFLNNGGQDHLVVRANYYDFQLPMLSVMEYNDYRLK